MLFLSYVDDLKNLSDLLMFADYTYIFFEGITYMFSTMNKELENTNETFVCNKVSLNTEIKRKNANKKYVTF